MPLGLLIGEDTLVAVWAASTFKRRQMPVDRAFGIVDNGLLKGAILLHNFNGINIEMSYYGPNTLTAGITRAVARVLITEFNVARLTVVTSKRNKRLMHGLTKLGFALEGHQKRFYGHNDCNRNTGVRFVAFREAICKVAGIDPVLAEQKG